MITVGCVSATSMWWIWVNPLSAREYPIYRSSELVENNHALDSAMQYYSIFSEKRYERRLSLTWARKNDIFGMNSIKFSTVSFQLDALLERSRKVFEISLCFGDDLFSGDEYFSSIFSGFSSPNVVVFPSECHWNCSIRLRSICQWAARTVFIGHSRIIAFKFSCPLFYRW